MNYFLQIPIRLIMVLLNLAQGANQIIQRHRPQVEAFLYAQLCIFVIALIFMCAGVMFNLSLLVTGSAIAIAFIFFISWCLPDLTLELAAKVTSRVPVTSSITEEVAKEMRQLLRPLLSVSTVFAFIACWVSVRGIHRYNVRDIFILGSFFFFIWLFLFYIESKTRWAGYVELVVLVVLIISTYLFPVQVKSVYCWAERNTINRSVLYETKDLDQEMVNIHADVTCYGKKGDEFQAIGKAGELGFKNTSSIVKAKVLDRDDDASSKEAIYKVQLPLEDDLYLGGKIVYVPCRMVAATVKEEKKEETTTSVSTTSVTTVTQPVQQVTVATPAVTTVSTGKVLSFSIQPHQLYTIDNVRGGQEWSWRNIAGTFSQRVDTGNGSACWKIIDHPSTWSADVSGTLQIRAGDTPVYGEVHLI